MASPKDIVLKIKADVTDAVRGMRDLDKASDQAGQSVDGVSTKLTKLVGTGGRIAEAAKGLFEWIDAADQAGAQLDQMTGAADAIAKQAGNLQFAGSSQDVENAFFATANARAKSYNESGGILGNLRSVGVDIGRRLTGGGRPLSPSTEREYVELFRELSRTDPARASSLLSQSDLDRAEYLRPRLESEYARAQAGRAYTEQLGSSVNITNVYTGIGDRAQIGRTIEAAHAARARNNGQSVTTYSRRG